MAQQFIKIFDDTVLKQSVNQGYESQRRNSRLGKFTMGELAFTRDTARLFVGNHTTLSNSKDSGEITGGVLVGNKYLGLIDSKPLTHYIQSETNATCVYLPLSYEQMNEYISKVEETVTNEAGETITQTVTKTHHENPLFASNSKFRRDSKNNGWSKDSEYNAEWDAYNGDYLFDVYNNALVLFDKRIKPVSIIDNPNWIINDKNQQQFYSNKDTDSFFTEEGNKDNYSTERTPLINVEKQASEEHDVLGNEKYPIYGNGYVVMRILEPDNKTLCYKERRFNQDTGFATDNNYSHNYIELKSVPVELIKDYFDSSQFKYDESNKSIMLNTTSEQGFTLEKISGSKLSITNKVIYRDELNNYPFTIKYIKPQVHDREVTASQNPEYIPTTYSLCIIPDQIVTEGESKRIEWKTSVLESPKIRIKYKSAISNTFTLTPGSNQEIELFEEEKTTDKGYIITDPFPSEISDDGSAYTIDDEYTPEEDEGEDSTDEEFETAPLDEVKPSSQFEKYVYNGNGIYTQDGQLVSCEQVIGVTMEEDGSFYADESTDCAEFVFYDSSSKDSTYKTIQDNPDSEESYEGKFAHPYIAVGHNYIKKPEPIAWGTSSGTVTSYGNFYLFPNVCSPKGYHTSNMGTAAHEIDATNMEWTKDVAMDQPFYDVTLSNSIIPDHAKTIVCELHFMPKAANSKFILLTDSDWTMFNDTTIPTDFKLFVVDSVSTIPTISTASATHKMIAQSYGGYPTSTRVETNTETGEVTNITTMAMSNDCRIVEFPLYRDKNAMKYFNFCIKYNNASWVMRAIGYRA